MTDSTSRREEKRSESRYPTNDDAKVIVASFPTQQPCVIVNVSRSGLQLQISRTLPIGERIEVLKSGAMVVFGQVRYCRRSGDTFRAGVQIHDVIFAKAPAASEHIDEERLSLYATGHGLTSLEVLFAARHLECCEECRKTLTEVSKIVRFAHRSLPGKSSARDRS